MLNIPMKHSIIRFNSRSSEAKADLSENDICLQITTESCRYVINKNIKICNYFCEISNAGHEVKSARHEEILTWNI